MATESSRWLRMDETSLHANAFRYLPWLLKRLYLTLCAYWTRVNDRLVTLGDSFNMSFELCLGYNFNFIGHERKVPGASIRVPWTLFLVLLLFVSWISNCYSKVLYLSQAMRTCVLRHMRTTKAHSINAFVVRCQDKMIPLVYKSEISRF